MMGVTLAYAISCALLLLPGLAIAYRLIQLPLSDLLRSVRGTLVGALVMSGVVALARDALIKGEVGQTLTLAGSVATGIVTYLTWLWLTDSRAIEEVRLAWAQFAQVRREEVSEG